MSRAGYDVDIRSIGISVSLLTDLSKERRRDILKTAQSILEEKATQTQISSLKKKYKEAEESLEQAEKGKGKRLSSAST